MGTLGFALSGDETNAGLLQVRLLAHLRYQ
jgi:hypothetical protein